MHNIFIFTLSITFSFSQINPKDIEIVRDSFGVAHIYGKTDADTAYGLAWAHSEDDFLTIQKAYLAGNGLLSKHLKNKGIIVDFLNQFIGSKISVKALYNSLSSEFIKIFIYE